VGEWGKLPDGMKGATCQKANDAVVHNDEAEKKETVTLEWTAEKDIGDVEFRATVVEDFKIFYEIKSEKITYQEEDLLIPIESNASIHSLKIFILPTNLFVFLAYFYV